MSAGTAAKRALYACLDRSGANAVLRTVSRSRVLVLCYHGVVHDRPRDASYLYRNAISEASFDAQMASLSRLCTPISAGQLLAAVEQGQRLPRSPALVTFDDGFRNNVQHAVPILKRHAIPAVFHVATGYIGTNRILWPLEVDLRLLQWPTGRPAPCPTQGPDLFLPERSERQASAQSIREACKRLPDDARVDYLRRLRERGDDGDVRQFGDLLRFMDWDDVRRLHREGFDIGSHTVEHPILSRLDGDAVARELRQSKRKIEAQIQAPCRTIAYPNGGVADYDHTVIEATRAAGYRAAFSLAERRARPGAIAPWAVPRICVPAECPPATFRARISGAYEVLNWLRG
ncbi:MAG: polysaccharide deacetylase family protein [Vicinamibacterales bacterium]